MVSLNTSDIQGQDTALASIMNIADIKQQYEDKLFEQAEHENVDHIVPENCDDELAEVVVQLQLMDAAIEDIENSDDTLHTLMLIYCIYLWSKQHPEAFQKMLDAQKVKVRKDAQDAIPVIKYLEKLSGVTRTKQCKTKWAKTLQLALRQNTPVEEFFEKINSYGGWSAASKLYDDKFGKAERAASRKEKEKIENHRISYLEEALPVISELPSNDGIDLCCGTSGLGILIYREGVDGADGILCRLSITVDDVEKLIHKHRANLTDGQIEDIITNLIEEQDDTMEVADAA